MNRKGKETIDFLQRELRHWPGVEIDEIRQTRTHPKVYFTFNGKRRWITVSASPSCPFTVQNKLGEVRRMLRDELGALRLGPKPREPRSKAS